MSDQSTAGNTPSLISKLFSSPVIALLRYALAAIGPLFALAGFAVLTPDRINHIVEVVQQFGMAAAAVSALLGVVIPITVAIYGAIKSTFKSQISRVKELANNPELANAEAQKALISATSQIAPKNEDAKQALIAATIAMPSVQTIVTDAATAAAAPSESVVAAPKAA